MLRAHSNQAFTLVEILIAAGIIALISVIGVPNMISMKRTANETAAKANLRAFSSAAETAYISLGHYPVTLGELQQFINSAPIYCADIVGTQTAIQGYNYSCTMGITGYTITASPVALGTTGNVTYTANTGGLVTPL
jgi:prepilin-type N-terminal cleavage/methylation domain-containing protein